MSLFDGVTFDESEDGDRLRGQLGRVYSMMRGGQWWRLRELVELCGGTEAAISARIRDLRKEKWGGHTVQRRRVVGANGLWEYRLADGDTAGIEAIR